MKKSIKKRVAAKKVKKASKPVVRTNKGKAGVMPLGDRVMVKPAGLEEGLVTSFGIVLPDSAKEKPEQGRVVAVGPGRKGEDGKLIPMSVKVGDKVMFSKYGFDEIKVDGAEYYLIREDNILAILE